MSATFTAPPLDFEVVRETWAKYELGDGSILKVKVTVTKVVKVSAAGQLPTTPPSPSTYNIDFQNTTVLLTNERGPPDTTVHSPQEIASHIIRDNIRFRTVEQDWNEYLTDDNARILVQPIVMRVAKTSFFNNKGEPIYYVEIQGNIQIRPPGGSTPALPLP